MDEELKQYAVINAADSPPFFQHLADALVEAHGMHRLDALQKARGRHYIFDTALREDQANALRDFLGRQGVDGLVVPMEHLTELGPAVGLTHADCLADGFLIHPLRAKPFPVLWENLAVLAHGTVINVTQHRPKQFYYPGAETGTDLGSEVWNEIFIGPGDFLSSSDVMKPDMQPREDTERLQCLDIFAGNLADAEFAAHFRVVANRFSYDYLGPRKQPTSHGNFGLFVRDILAHAPNVMLTERTRRFLAGDVGMQPFGSFASFDEYNNWAVAMERARKG